MFNVQMDERASRSSACTSRSGAATWRSGCPTTSPATRFLLELFSRFTGIRAGLFGHTLVDAHVYTPSPMGRWPSTITSPASSMQLERAPRTLPRLTIDPAIRSLEDMRPLLEADTETVMRHFTLAGYAPHPPIAFKVAV